jgi:hypothetical protein
MFQDILAMGASGGGGSASTVSKIVGCQLNSSYKFVADKDYKTLIFIVNSSILASRMLKNGTDAYDYSVTASTNIGVPNISMDGAPVSSSVTIVFNDVKTGDYFQPSSGGSDGTIAIGIE